MTEFDTKEARRICDAAREDIEAAVRCVHQMPAACDEIDALREEVGRLRGEIERLAEDLAGFIRVKVVGEEGAQAFRAVITRLDAALTPEASDER